MKKAFLAFVLMLATMWSLSAQTSANPPDILATDSTTTSLPYASNWNYSMSQQIYTANELNLPAGRLTKLWLRKTFVSTTMSQNIEVYIGHTTKSSFTGNSDFVSTGSMVKVFDGTVTPPTASVGYLEIPFSTTFDYDGTSNIVIYYRNKTGSYPTSSYVLPYYCINTSRANSSVRAYSDVNAVYCDPSQGSASGRYVGSGRNVIKFSYVPRCTSVTLAYGDETKLNPLPTMRRVSSWPLKTSMYYTISEQIITEEEMNGAREISALEFHLYEGTASRLVEIYMGTVSQSGFNTASDLVNCNTLNLVYRGDFNTSGQNRWIRIDLDKNFHYNGTGNVVIGIRDVTGTGTTEDVYFYADTLNSTSPYRLVTAQGYGKLGYAISSYTGVAYANYRYHVKLVSPGYTLGNGAGTTARPINPYYKYSCGQMIYSAQEVGGAGQISGVSLMNTSGYALNRNVEIYVGHTSVNSFASSSPQPIPITSLTKVYDGTTDFPGDCSYVYFGFNNPFFYNGRDNLVLYFRDKTGTYATGQQPTFAYEVVSPNKFIGDYNDTRTCSPSDWQMSSSTYRPIVCLNFVKGSSEIGTCAVNLRAGEPFNDDHNYMLEQIIYTADELGNQPIKLTSMAFKQVSGNISRHGYIYLSETDKTTFDDGNDWEPLDGTSKAYVGTFTFNKTDDWATITFTNPFNYSGTKNLCVSILDYTGTNDPAQNANTPYFCQERKPGYVLKALTDVQRLNTDNVNNVTTSSLMEFRPIAKFTYEPLDACTEVITVETPYVQDFQATVNPACWVVGNISTSTNPGISNTTTATDASTNYSMSIYDPGQYIATPVIAHPLSDVKMSFRIWKQSGNTNKIIIGYLDYSFTNSASGFNLNFHPIDTLPYVQDSRWVNYSVAFNEVANFTDKRIVFYCDGTVSNKSFHIDDVTIQPIGPLTLPSFNSLTTTHQKVKTNITTNSASVSTLELRICTARDPNSSIWTNGSLTSGQVNPSANLQPTTTYYAYLRTVYAQNFKSDWVVKEFTTGRQPQTLPLALEFEEDLDSKKWTFQKSIASSTTGWYAGSAAFSEGEGGLYISNDGGASNTYAASNVVATAITDVQITAGTYEVQYDWRCRGEVSSSTSVYDYFRVYLAPATTTDSIIRSYFNYAGVPTGCLPLDGGTKLNTGAANAEWQNYSGTVTVPTTGIYKVVFMWRNDGSVVYNPPVAIDRFFLGNTVTTTVVDTTCDNVPYTKYGFNISPDEMNAAMLARQHRHNDTIYNLRLYLKHAKITEYTGSTCEDMLPMMWHGISCTHAGDWYDVHETADGCDSTNIFHLTVYPAYRDTTFANVCPSELPYSWHGHMYSTAGTYYETGFTSHSCDSSFVLILTVNPVKTATVNWSVHSYELPLTWNGITISSDGTYTYTTTGSNGCDSVTTLNVVLSDLPVRQLPYVTGFESTARDADWYFYNNTPATGKSKWVFGTAGSRTGRGLYVSNDNGATNSYYQSANDNIFAVLPIHAQADQYVVGYDWKCEGESSYDFARVYLVRAADFDSVALRQNVDYDNLPDYCISLDDNYQLQGNINWTRKTTMVSLNNDDYYVVFQWISDHSVFNDPAIAIDNFSFVAATVINYTDNGCDNEAYNNYGFSISRNEMDDHIGLRHFSRISNDTIYNLALTVNEHKVTVLDTVHVCSSDLPYDWDGMSVNSQNWYVKELQTSTGCDSLVQRYFVLHNADFTNIVDSIEVGASYNFQGDILTEAGVYTWQTVNRWGCDSTVQLILNLRLTNVETLPIVSNFEDATHDNDWAILNGEDNKWVVGSAAACTGNRSLYISNDNGITNSYISSSNKSQAVRLVDVPAGNYDIHFDWRSLGELSYDYFRVYLVPTQSVSLQTLHTWYVGYDVLPSDAIALDGGTALANDGNSWNSFDDTVAVAAGRYYLVVNWYDDGSVSYNPPAAIDNFFFGQLKRVAINDAICVGENYNLHGFNLAASDLSLGTNVETRMSNDTLYTLTLVVNQPTASDQEAHICNTASPYVWNGQSLMSSGRYTYTTTGANGCDSVVTLNLVVNDPSTGTVEEEVCSVNLPYYWNGLTINASGTYVAQLTANNGCDSIVTLYLTVNNPAVDTTYATFTYGGSYTFMGQTYTQSGTYSVVDEDSPCGDTHFLVLNAVTPTVDNLPFACDFENETVNDGWLFINTRTGTSTSSESKWTIGTANPYQGNKSLYVSNDNGVSNHYESTGNVTLAVRRIHSNGGTIDYGFDWRCKGESTYDYFRVYLAPVASNTLESLKTWRSANGLPNSTCIALDGNTKLSNADSLWRARVDTVTVPTGDYYLVVLWYDDSSVTYNPPAAVDNVVLGTITRQTITDHGCRGEAYTRNGFNIPASNLNNTGNYTLTSLVGTTFTTLNLTVDAPKTSSMATTICNAETPYLWNGQSLTTSGTYTYTTTAANGCDSTVTLFLTVNQSKSNTVTLSLCSSELPYNWHGQNITASGSYTWTGTASNNCDSVVTLNVTVSQAKQSSVSHTVCNTALPYVWNGQSLTAAGTYTYTTTAANGCDSVVTLTLSISQSKVTNLTHNVCASDLPYLWNGQSLNVAGTYTYNTVAGNGCDSVVNLTLVVNQAATGAEAVSVCPSELPYTWHGQSLNAAGSYTWNGTTAAGCDSVVTLTLTVKQAKATNLTQTVCPSDLPYYWNGQVLNAAGTYTFTTTAANGCDSVVALTFAVGQTKTANVSAAVCDNELPYLWNGQSLTAAGSYTYSTTSATGCDSIVTLTLTVNATFQGTETLDLESSELPYTWNGQTITAAGTYTYNGTTAAGCDSIVTLTVTVTTVGLEYFDEQLFRISPNPVKRGETVRIDAEVGEPFTVELYTSESKLVKRISAEETPLYITVPEVDGLYLVRLVTSSGRVLYGKVIVK